MNIIQKERSLRFFKKALTFFKNDSDLAKKLNLNRKAIYAWKKGIVDIPPIHALEIQELTNDKVTAYQLRPDIKVFKNLKGFNNE